VLIAAVQVMQLVGDRDGTAGRPLEDVFDPADQPALEAICATLEGNTARQKNPHKRGSLAYATWGLRAARWLDDLLWQTGTVVFCAGCLAVQGHRAPTPSRLIRSGPKRTPFERDRQNRE